jgi:hypothetical protein
MSAYIGAKVGFELTENGLKKVAKWNVQVVIKI